MSYEDELGIELARNFLINGNKFFMLEKVSEASKEMLIGMALVLDVDTSRYDNDFNCEVDLSKEELRTAVKEAVESTPDKEEKTMEQITKFVVGETYYGDSGDGKQEQFTVVSRTPKFITLSGNMILTTQRVKVTVEHGRESAVYAMTSWCKFVIRADSAVKEADNKEDTTMAAKVSVKASLNEAISAIEAARTEDAVRTVLEKCTKAQIEEVYIAITGNEEGKAPRSWIKASLVLYYAERIIAHKAREAFKEMTIAEKAEYLKSGKYSEAHCCLDEMLYTCTPYDLISLVRVLGIIFKVYEIWHKEKPSVSFEPILRIVIDNALDVLKLSEQSEPASKDDDPAREPAEVSYADVKEAYGRYNMAQGEYKDSHSEDEELKAVADEALNKYLDLLKVYAGKPSAEQEEVRAFLVSEFGGLFRPLDGVAYLSSKTLVEMSHKAGLHADWRMSSRDMGIRLLRWSGIGCETKTTEEQALPEVEELNERKDSLEAEITDKRRELLGIAEALKAMKGSRHYSGLLVLKARIEEEYKALRLESLRVRKELRWYAEHLDELREMLKEIQSESCQQLLVAI